MAFAPRKDWVDTTLNVENKGALISSDFKPFKIGGAPTIFAGPGWATSSLILPTEKKLSVLGGRHKWGCFSLFTWP